MCYVLFVVACCCSCLPWLLVVYSYWLLCVCVGGCVLFVVYILFVALRLLPFVCCSFHDRVGLLTVGCYSLLFGVSCCLVCIVFVGC